MVTQPSDTFTVGPLTLPKPALLGVLNVTPDSFSDGGRYATLDRAVAAAERMAAQGADLIDVGGESTRPGAEPVSTEEELARVVPVVEALASRIATPISVDTSHPEVMRAALAAGAQLVNDVRALSRPGALEAVAESDAAVCLMHMRGTPLTMQTNPDYAEVVDEVAAFLEHAVQRCEGAGITRSRIMIDPGFGFGKTLQHNLTLLARLPELQSTGCPVLVGVSRKSMFGQLLDRAVDERLAGTLAAGQLALDGGAHVLRVHDVAEHHDMRQVWQRVRALRHNST
ncbi:MAG: dihydropteroate synthase [Pseudomonadota bacterium]